MKKNLSICSLIVLVLLLSAGQSKAQISLGLKGGLNVSNLNGLSIPDVETNALVGFHVGAFLPINLGRNFALQPELVYSTQGAKLEGALDEDYKLNYFNVPVMLRFYTNGGFFLEAGPQLGFQVGDVSLDDDDYEDELNNSDFSICGGLGFMGKSQKFGIGARYNVGVSKLGDLSSTNFEDTDFKNGVFQLSLYWRLFGKKMDKK
jgi:hypothetical protein